MGHMWYPCVLHASGVCVQGHTQCTPVRGLVCATAWVLSARSVSLHPEGNFSQKREQPLAPFYEYFAFPSSSSPARPSACKPVCVCVPAPPEFLTLMDKHSPTRRKLHIPSPGSASLKRCSHCSRQRDLLHPDHLPPSVHSQQAQGLEAPSNSRCWVPDVALKLDAASHSGGFQEE